MSDMTFEDIQEFAADYIEVVRKSPYLAFSLKNIELEYWDDFITIFKNNKLFYSSEEKHWLCDNEKSIISVYYEVYELLTEMISLKNKSDDSLIIEKIRRRAMLKTSDEEHNLFLDKVISFCISIKCKG